MKPCCLVNLQDEAQVIGWYVQVFAEAVKYPFQSTVIRSSSSTYTVGSERIWQYCAPKIK